MCTCNAVGRLWTYSANVIYRPMETAELWGRALVRWKTQVRAISLNDLKLYRKTSTTQKEQKKLKKKTIKSRKIKQQKLGKYSTCYTLSISVHLSQKSDEIWMSRGLRWFRKQKFRFKFPDLPVSTYREFANDGKHWEGRFSLVTLLRRDF